MCVCVCMSFIFKNDIKIKSKNLKTNINEHMYWEETRGAKMMGSDMEIISIAACTGPLQCRTGFYPQEDMAWKLDPKAKGV